MDAESFGVFQNRSQETLYRINWQSAGKWRRFKVRAKSVEEAAQQGRELIAEQLVEDKISRTDRENPRVLDAFDLALAATRRKSRSQADWNKVRDKFLLWLAEHHPECENWHMLTRAIIREYMEQFSGKASNTVRLAMNPICQTAGYMEREYSLPNIASRLGLSSTLAKTPPLVPLEDVVDLVGWVREHDPYLEVGVGLAGLGGLQLMEVLRLTWNKVDLKRGLIEISGEVKNSYRERCIPVCGLLLEILQRAQALREVRQWESKVQILDGSDPVMASPEGLTFAKDNSFRNYGKRVKARILEWNPKVSWAPKDLRNCLPSFAMFEQLHSDVWEQYIGHSPRTVTARNYIPRLASATEGERKLLERQMDIFRKLVVDYVDREIARQSHESQQVGKTCAIQEVVGD